MRSVKNVLVLCTGNSARSILLESILNRDGKGRLRAWSAGPKPAGIVHPQALALLARQGYDTSDPRSESWDEFAGPGAPQMDIVITVCNAAAGETCPIWPGSPLRAHWGVADPAAAPEAQQQDAFELAYAQLSTRATALLHAPFETMPDPALKDLLDRIGKVG